MIVVAGPRHERKSTKIMKIDGVAARVAGGSEMLHHG
jgi:hypothetical protein